MFAAVSFVIKFLLMVALPVLTYKVSYFIVTHFFESLGYDMTLSSNLIGGGMIVFWLFNLSERPLKRIFLFLISAEGSVVFFFFIAALVVERYISTGATRFEALLLPIYPLVFGIISRLILSKISPGAAQMMNFNYPKLGLRLLMDRRAKRK